MQIVDIPAEKYFYVCDGTVIKHLGELPDALRNMHPGAFEYHVNDEKNDFYNWVKDVFDKSGLARRIKNIRTKETMAKHAFIEVFS